MLSCPAWLGSPWETPAEPVLAHQPLFSLAALRSRPIVALVHPGVVELGLAHDAIAGMRRAHVGQVAFIVGHAQHRSDSRSGGGQQGAQQGHHLVEVLFGRYRSNSSKIRRYSSAQEEGLTNA